MKHQPTPEQKAKAEERRQNLRDLWKKIGEMSEEQRAAFVDKAGTVVTCEGHPLTPNNAILLAYQADGVSVVGGYKQWLRMGRQVRKGEHSLGIWIPSNPGKDGEDGAGNEKKRSTFFVFGSVFDISQTDPIQ